MLLGLDLQEKNVQTLEMQQDVKPKPTRKFAVVPPITIQQGTPCPPSPLADAEEQLKQGTLPQISQNRNVLGGGMPCCVQQQLPDRKLSEPHVGAAPKLEQASYGGLRSSHESFATPTCNPRMHRSSLASQFPPPFTHSSNPNLLQLPQIHYPYHPQSPTFSEVSSIVMGSPRSPISRLPSGDPHSNFYNHCGRKIGLPPLCASSYPDIDDCGLSPLFPSFSPYLGSISDVSAGFQSTGCLTSRKRPLSISPLSDLADFGSLIRSSPNSLVALMGSNPSPGFLALSPNPPGAIGHLVGQSTPNVHVQPQYMIKERKTSIEHKYAEGSVDTTITKQITFSGQSGKLQHPPVAANGQPNLSMRPAPDLIEFQSMATARTSCNTDANFPPTPKEQQHIFTQEPEIHEPQQCQWGSCSLQLDSITELVQHIETIHIEKGAVEEYICQWKDCPRRGRPFNARYKLVIHMRIHSGEKPNKCRYQGCNKAFSRLENLKIHMRTHTGEKPYICQFQGCNKSFSNSSDRSKHQKTHVEQKPYACNFPGCEKRYTDPSSLRKHAKIHTQHRKKPRNEQPIATENLDDCLTIQGLGQFSSSGLHQHGTHKRALPDLKTSRTHQWKKTAREMAHNSTSEQLQQPQTQVQHTATAYLPAAQPPPAPYLPVTCAMEHLQPLSPPSPYYGTAQASPGNMHSPMILAHQYSPHSSDNAATFISSPRMAEYASLSPAQVHSLPQVYPTSPAHLMALSPGEQLMPKIPSPASIHYQQCHAHHPSYLEPPASGDVPTYLPDHPPPRYEDSIASMNAMAPIHPLMATEAVLPNYQAQGHHTPGTSHY